MTTKLSMENVDAQVGKSRNVLLDAELYEERLRKRVQYWRESQPGDQSELKRARIRVEAMERTHQTVEKEVWNNVLWALVGSSTVLLALWVAGVLPVKDLGETCRSYVVQPKVKMT